MDSGIGAKDTVRVANSRKAPILSSMWHKSLARRILYGLGFLLATGILADEVEAPVPLLSPLPLVPPETAGSGLAPEARVRVELNERGIVTAVEVASIRPSTEHDARFEAALQRTLRQWRYAPQRRDGVAEPTSLEWLVRFPARPGTDASDGWVGPPVLPGADAEVERSRILALPLEERARLLDAQARRAVAAFDGEHHRADSALFVVYTDAGAEVAEGLAQNLEAIFFALGQDFVPALAPYPDRYKLQAFVFRSRASYQSFLADMPQYEWSAGFYSPAGLIALHLEQSSNDEVMSVLLHEATHAFVDRRIVRRGVALPRWLGEGFADYVGNSRIKKGKLQPGRVRRGALEMHRGEITRVTTGSAASLDEVKRVLRSGQGLGVEALLEASSETFYGEGRSQFYDTAWLFVHYLREGEPTWASREFPTLLLYLAEGYPPRQAFETVYGGIEAADRAFREYVKRF